MQMTLLGVCSATEDHNTKDPRHAQKPIYCIVFSNHICSRLLLLRILVYSLVIVGVNRQTLLVWGYLVVALDCQPFSSVFVDRGGHPEHKKHTHTIHT